MTENNEISHLKLCDEAWHHHFTPEQPCGICIALRKMRENTIKEAVQAVKNASGMSGAIWARDAVDAVKALNKNDSSYIGTGMQYAGEWHCSLYGHDYDSASFCKVCGHDGCEMGSQ